MDINERKDRRDEKEKGSKDGEREKEKEKEKTSWTLYNVPRASPDV